MTKQIILGYGKQPVIEETWTVGEILAAARELTLIIESVSLSGADPNELATIEEQVEENSPR